MNKFDNYLEVVIERREEEKRTPLQNLKYRAKAKAVDFLKNLQGKKVIFINTHGIEIERSKFQSDIKDIEPGALILPSKEEADLKSGKAIKPYRVESIKLEDDGNYIITVQKQVKSTMKMVEEEEISEAIQRIEISLKEKEQLKNQIIKLFRNAADQAYELCNEVAQNYIKDSDDADEAGDALYGQILKDNGIIIKGI